MQMEEAKEKRGKASYSSVSYYKLFSFADTIDRLLMLVGTLAAVGNGTCMPIMSVLFGNLIDSAGRNFDVKLAVHEVCQVSVKFFYLALGSGLASFLQVTCWMITAERQVARIRSTYLRTILRQDVAFFDEEISTGEVVARMSSDTILIQDAMGEKVGSFIQLLATFVSGYIVAFAQGRLLTIFLLSTIPLIMLSGAITVIFIHKMAREAQNSYSIAATVAEQTISSIRTVVSFCGEKQAIRKYNKALDKAYRSSVQEGFAAGLGFGTLGFIFFCSYGFAIWFGGKMIVEKGYTGGVVLSVIFAVLLGSFSLGQASPCLNVFAAGQAAASKMFHTISRNPDIDALDASGQTRENISGDIELSNVHFCYPARPNEQILCGLSLFIPAGSTAALVGQSGSGKSTVISLIERFYDPQDGQVFIDGIDIKKFQLRWIRNKISLVSQEPVLFSGSIKDNIAYGKDGAPDEEIIAAAKLANAAKFIQALPQGLETMVGEHGVQLSGGQKQRIAIARAIIKEPKILLLDEATSALDAKSERCVQEALDRVMNNRTTVVIAHRLSTIRNADKIYVIHQGVVVESGSHSELIKTSDGVYSQLIRLQEASQQSEHYVTNDPCNHQMLFPVPYSKSPSFSESTPETSFFSVPCSMSPSSNTYWKMSVADTDSLDSDLSSKKAGFLLLRLACLNKPEVPVMLLGTIMAAANGTVYPIFGSFLARIVKIFHEQASELLHDAKYQAIMFVVLGLASFLATPSSTYFFAVAGCRLIRRIRSMCFEKVVYMEVSWFDEDAHSSGAIGSRLSADATSVRSLVGDTLALLVQNFATAVAAVLMAFEANWELALVMLFLLPLIGISGYIQMNSVKGFGADAKKTYEEANQIARDAVSIIRTVASFCSEEKTVQLYQRKCEGPIKSGMRRGLVSGVGFGLSFFFLNFVNAVSFYSGAQLVNNGKTTFPEVFQVYFVLLMAALGISQANSLAPNANKARSSAASVFDILDQKSEIDASDSSGARLENVKGDIRFHNIWFTYPMRPDIRIFKDFCLSIYAGQTVALVGESGSGKSTVMSLLQRYYHPDSGHITLDETDIRKLNVKWLRQQMGLVSQEPILFNETIRENIAYGKEGDATEAEIIAAAELANAHNFISGLQLGYDTMVGERGVQLSGGQKQRIAIARAIVKTPKILLLDEATSALDAESECVVQDALDRVMVNRTTLVIAHRLSTIRNADIIAMLKNGQIAEEGTHETLLDIKNGIYASLVAAH